MQNITPHTELDRLQVAYKHRSGFQNWKRKQELAKEGIKFVAIMRAWIITLFKIYLKQDKFDWHLWWYVLGID